MTTASSDDACPFEWAEYNLPQELRSAAKSISPFARVVFDAAQTPPNNDSASPLDVRLPSGTRLGSLLLPGLGIPLPKL